MEDYKVKLNAAVAARLCAAPPSAEKDELIEELSDNLYRRFLDMTGAGVPEEEAFTRAIDDLGDVNELLAYLRVEPADNAAAGQEEDRERSGGSRNRSGGAHYNYSGQTSQSDLDAIMANVTEICRVAMDQVKEAAKQAKEAIQRRTTVEKDSGHVKVHFNTTPETPEAPETLEASEPPKGWEFEAELDADEGRFFAGAGPRQRRDIIYGFGYDKAKGGFFAQWGEWKGSKDSGQKPSGPYFRGEDAGMAANDDGSYSITALKDLRGIVVQTVAGDVTIHAELNPDAGVVIDGDVDDLDVTCSADGVLTIREGRTASSSFFSRRGFSSADVDLHLPCRLWESIEVTTASGDVDIDGSLEIEHLGVTTASGDVSCHINSCTCLHFKSASGDLDFTGDCVDVHAETVSGDIHLDGQLDRAKLRSASGDIQLDGSAGLIHAGSMSGDVEVETCILPQVMELSSKSGDCRARIPDAGPFALHMKTISGEMDFEFQFNYINGTFVYGDGSGPAYSITTVSGDVTVERY